MERAPGPTKKEERLEEAGGPPEHGDRRSGLRALLLFSGEAAALDLQLLGRTLLHAALVGVLAGIVGAGFFAALEVGQQLVLEGMAGFAVLRARGETFSASSGQAGSVRLWALALFPTLGGLASGLLTSSLAPEAAGGGGDATIEACHRGGVIRRRVIPVKALASILVLASGGSGGREGPTMQIGAAIGAAIGRFLPTSRAERRVLLIAGIAAGIAAVFRTPVGAALLATEMLYRDDVEADALVPSIFASVVSYSVVIALFGETSLFGPLPRHSFSSAHLPLYALLAIVVALAAAGFARLLRLVQSVSSRHLPPWASPALGGLLMGVLGAAIVAWMRGIYGPGATGFGVFGGGYGALQVAISGAAWMPSGAGAVWLLLLLALAKIVASALTIGSGAAAGDFAPSLVVGGLIGSAFGHAARFAFGDPSIDPAAFALVGMGTFYGGIAHTPLAALVLVAELAGSYDLLVPMMLAIGIAYVALRRDSLYPAQRASRLAAPAVRPETPEGALLELVSSRSVREAVIAPELDVFDAHAPLAMLAAAASSARDQRVAIVKGRSGFSGLVELGLLAELPPDELQWMRAHDASVPFVAVEESSRWSEVARLLEGCGVSQLPVLRDGLIVGWVGDRELRRALLEGVEAQRS
jgi:CIC family chloride channel protein